MFTVNEDNSVYLTRGDALYLGVTAEDRGVPFWFRVGDLLRIKVFDRKRCGNVVLQRDFPVTEAGEKVSIYLTGEETRFGDMISKPRDYWYEVELNPDSCPMTIIGYDEEGPAVLRLFPEGAESAADVPQPTPEDIGPVDEELDLLSARPVENRVVTRMFVRLQAELDELREAIREGVES